MLDPHDEYFDSPEDMAAWKAQFGITDEPYQPRKWPLLRSINRYFAERL